MSIILNSIGNTFNAIGLVFQNFFYFIQFYIFAPILLLLFVGVLIYLQYLIIKFYLYLGKTLSQIPFVRQYLENTFLATIIPNFKTKESEKESEKENSDN